MSDEIKVGPPTLTKYNVTNVKKLTEFARKHLRNRLLRVAKVWEDYLLKKRAEPKTGRKYSKTIDGKLYKWTASRAGEYPAKVTGRLLDNMRMRVEMGETFGRVKVAFDRPYATHFEEITPLTKNRPFIRQSKEDLRKVFEDIILRGRR